MRLSPEACIYEKPNSALLEHLRKLQDLLARGIIYQVSLLPLHGEIRGLLLYLEKSMSRS